MLHHRNNAIAWAAKDLDTSRADSSPHHAFSLELSDNEHRQVFPRPSIDP